MQLLLAGLADELPSVNQRSQSGTLTATVTVTVPLIVTVAVTVTVTVTATATVTVTVIVTVAVTVTVTVSLVPLNSSSDVWPPRQLRTAASFLANCSPCPPHRCLCMLCMRRT